MLRRFFFPNFPVQTHHLLFFVFLIILLPKTGYYFDMIDRPAWIAYMKAHGFMNIYGSGANYLPLGLYFLYFFGLFFDNPETILTHFYQFKIIVLLFDFAAAIGFTSIFRNQISKKYLEYLLLFNLAYLYNTLFWGQQDGIHCALMLFSLAFLLKNKPISGVVFALLAVNAKLQSIIILPIVAIILIPYLVVRNTNSWEFNFRLLAKIVLWAVGVQLLILLPFLLTGRLNEVLGVMKNSVGFFPRISWGAYNCWYLLTNSDPFQIGDATVVHRLSYKNWGFLLFFGLSALALLPILLRTITLILKNETMDKAYYSLTFLTAGLLALIFFFVNTQMHERYSHPVLLFFFAYAVLSERYILYILASLAYFFNLDGIYQYFHLTIGVPIIEPKLIALLFLAILVATFLKIYRNFGIMNDVKYVKMFNKNNL